MALLNHAAVSLPQTFAGYGLLVVSLVSYIAQSGKDSKKHSWSFAEEFFNPQLFAYLVFGAVYNLYFHPLANYPGPFLARAGRLWYVNSLIRGNLPFDVHAAHVKYGDIVRVGPDELAYIHVDAWKDIYGLRTQGGEIPKDPNFYLNTAAGALSIIAAPAKRHGEIRRILAHGFSDKALREQEPIVQGHIDLLMARLRELAIMAVDVDIVMWYNFFSFDVIGDLAFGESFGCLEQSKYHPWIDIVFHIIHAGTFARGIDHYPLLKRPLKAMVPKWLKEAVATHLQLMKSKALHRLHMDTDRLDLLTRMAAKDSGLTQEEVIASADTILLGGSETTGTLLSGATYYLVQNPDRLAKLVAEVRQRFTDEQQIDFSAVNGLEYMLACLNEAFRVYPPVPGALPRRTVKVEKIAGKYVPPNTTVTIYQWAMNHSSQHFLQPEEYIPERWLGDERFVDDTRSAMQPFSVGPRNCVGRNLAYVEMRIILARLLFNFDIEPTPRTKGWNVGQKVFLLWEKPSLWIKLRPRDVRLRAKVTEILRKDSQK